MATDGASASSSASESSEKSEAIKKASELLAQGKRNMVCGEIPKAVNFYEEAVQLLVKSCGELSRDCADAYFNCGSALLELGRMETSVLGAALEGVDVEEEKDEEANEQFEKPLENDSLERQELRKEVYEAMAEGDREEELKKSLAKTNQPLPSKEDAQAGDESKVDNTKTDILSEGSKQQTVKTVNDTDENMEDEQSTDTAAASKEGKEDSRSKPEYVTDNLVNEQNDDEKVRKECPDDKNVCSGDGETVDGKSQESAAGHEPEMEIAQTAEDKDVLSDHTDADQDGEVAEDANEEEEEDTAEDKDNQEGEEIEGEDKEEDVPNFQLSWEYLDLAKVIYLKSDAAEDQLKAAECYIRLGELSMETEQHATAAEDLESALKIQQKLLPANDRLIAETLYQLGLAYGQGMEFELSIKHYTEAIGVIEAKIASLNKLVEEAAVDTDDKEKPVSEQVKKYQDEITELQELIPEMKNKIEDAKEEAKHMEKMKDTAKGILGFSGSSKKFDSPTKKNEPSVVDKSAAVDENGQKKATDIAHLVRKKRKPDSDDLQLPNGQGRKRVRQDDSATQVSTADVKLSSQMDVSDSDDKLNAEQNKSETTTAEPVAC